MRRGFTAALEDFVERREDEEGEQAEDHDDRIAAKARECLIRGQQPGEDEREQQAETDDLRRDPLRLEKRERHREEAEEEKDLRRHGGGVLKRNSRGSSLFILFGASGVFGKLKDALNLIWGVVVKPGRPVRTLIRDRFLSFAMVLGIGFLLLASLENEDWLDGVASKLISIIVIGYRYD